MNSHRLRQKLSKRRNVFSSTTTLSIDQDETLIEAPQGASASPLRESSAIASLSGVALTIISLSVSDASAFEHASNVQIKDGKAGISRPDHRNSPLEANWQKVDVASRRDIHHQLESLLLRGADKSSAAQEKPFTIGDEGTFGTGDDQSLPLQDYVVLLNDPAHGDAFDATQTSPTILTVGDTTTVMLANGMGLKLTLTRQAEPEQELTLPKSPGEAQSFGQLNPDLLAEESEEAGGAAFPVNAEFLNGSWLNVETGAGLSDGENKAIYLEGTWDGIDFGAFADFARANLPVGNEGIAADEPANTQGNDDDDWVVATYDQSQSHSG
jgi:hypothetical protein